MLRECMQNSSSLFVKESRPLHFWIHKRWMRISWISTFSPPTDLILPSAAGLQILRNSADNLNVLPLVNSTSTWNRKKCIWSNNTLHNICISKWCDAISSLIGCISANSPLSVNIWTEACLCIVVQHLTTRLRIQYREKEHCWTISGGLLIASAACGPGFYNICPAIKA